MSVPQYDIIIIGAGPGGYVAAIRAAQLGLKTAIVEREHLGGICLNWGCIPTKALLRSAEVLDTIRHSDGFGIDAGPVSPDIGAIVARSRKVSGQLNTGIGFLLKKNKVDVIWGQATLLGDGKVSVRPVTKPAVEPAHPTPAKTLGTGEYSADHIIIATGARPRVLSGLEPDGRNIVTYFEAMVPADIPKSLLVMGSGAIGVEFASFYCAMGTDVTLVELASEILPQEDHEIAKLARSLFEKRGIQVMSSTKAVSFKATSKGVSVRLQTQDGSQETVMVDKVLSAAGAVPNIEDLGLEKLGIETNAAGIVVDGAGRTSQPGVYAIGDVAGAPMLAHKAEHEGVICVETIVNGSGHAHDRNRIPACTYCQPQIASVGLTEQAAKDAGHIVRTGRFPFVGNGKAVALGETDGLIKTVFDDATGELLGAHLVGPEVTELVQGFVTAMSLEATEEHLMEIIYPHPTLSEAMHESVLAAYGRAVHI